MSTHVQTARRYVPEKLRRLKRNRGLMESLRQRVSSLEEEVFRDIINGWTTHDPVLDFALVSCNGVYDPEIMEVRYKRLKELPFRHCGKQIAVVQQAKYDDEMFGCLLNAYIATVRRDDIRFDVQTLTMQIPVEPKYFVFREMLVQNNLAEVRGLKDESWLTVGPLLNIYALQQYTQGNADGVFATPQHNTMCDIAILPLADPDQFMEWYRLHASDIAALQRDWIRLQSGT